MSEANKQQVTIPTPQEFYLEVSPYTSYEITTKENLDDVARIEFYIGTIDSYCVECQQNSIFNCQGQPVLIKSREPVDTEEIVNSESISFFDRNYQNLKMISGFLSIQLATHVMSDRLFTVEAICTREKSHKMVFYFMVKNKKVMKIGQFPSLADLENSEIRKYRKALGNERYLELSRAVGLNAHGVGIGAFVYLRRIFEGLIEGAHKEAVNSSSWDEKSYAASHYIEEKIVLLKGFLPTFLVDHYSIYSILSLGIHSLNEEQCLGYFRPVLNGIELILDQKMQIAEAKRKEAETSNAINSIKGMIKKDR